MRVVVEPTYSLSATTPGGGTVTVAPANASYRSNAVVTLVNEDPACQPASTNDSEDAIADLESPRGRAAGDHRPAGLYAGDIGGRTGRSRVPSCAL